MEQCNEIYIFGTTVLLSRIFLCFEMDRNKKITKIFRSANDMQVPIYKFCYILNKLTAATRNPKDSLLSSTEIAMI